MEIQTQAGQAAGVEELWGVKQVADYLRVSACWVYRRAECGQLPHRRVGRGLRFRPHEIAAWVAAQPGRH